MTAEPTSSVLTVETPISDNTSAPSSREEPQEEMQHHDNSVSNLDEEFLSVLINLQSAEPDTQHEIGNPIVKSEGSSTKATATDEGRLQGLLFVLKRYLILAKECFQTLRFKFWKKGWILPLFGSL